MLLNLPSDLNFYISRFLNLSERRKFQAVSKFFKNNIEVYNFRDSKSIKDKKEIWYKTTTEYSTLRKLNVQYIYNFYKRKPYVKHIEHFNGYLLILEDEDCNYIYKIYSRKKDLSFHTLLKRKDKELLILYN